VLATQRRARRCQRGRAGALAAIIGKAELGARTTGGRRNGRRARGGRAGAQWRRRGSLRRIRLLGFRTVAGGLNALLGKALGGGILPVSAITADWDVLGVIKPGEHGSTFGGNPMAAAVGIAVIELLETGELQERSKRLGEHVLAMLRGANLPGIKEIRGSGLWWAVELDGTGRTGREVSLELLARGILAKDTHTWTIRFAPPLVVSEADLDAALATIIDVLGGSGDSDSVDA